MEGKGDLAEEYLWEAENEWIASGLGWEWERMTDLVKIR